MKKILLGILFCVLALSGIAQDEYVDSLRLELASADNDTAKIIIYGELFDYYYLQYDNNTADLYADTILFYAKKCRSIEFCANAYIFKGSLKYLMGDYAASAEYYGYAEPLAVYVQDTQLLSMVYTELGGIYGKYGDYDTAHEYLDKAMKEIKKMDDDEMYASILVNIAELYFNEKKYDTALVIYDRALKLSSIIDTRVAIYNNVARIQYEMGNVEEAKNTRSKMLPFIDEITDIYTYAYALNNISSFFIQEGEYDKAFVRMKEVDSICSGNTYNSIRIGLYQNYYDLYKGIGDFEQANHYMECCNSLKDSVYSVDIAEKLKIYEKRSMREKANLEIRLRDEEISHQKTLNMILFSIIAIVLVFIAVIAFLLVKKNRLNRKLNKLNNDLEQRDAEISSNLDYAREIQLGCMNNGLSESNLQMFVLDRPKAVVGGDFYISQVKGDARFVVVGDCTGHGISGGFLSVLGIKSVYAAVEKYDSLPEVASFINKEFCEIVSSADNLKGESLCLSVVKICGNELHFLLSKQKLWLVSDGEIFEYKSSNSMMGGASDAVFSEETLNVKTGDVVFLSSDGFPDQFGADGKLKYPRFRKLLLECSRMNPDDAKAFLSLKLDEWRGDLEQTDDVMVAGIFF